MRIQGPGAGGTWGPGAWGSRGRPGEAEEVGKRRWLRTELRFPPRPHPPGSGPGLFIALHHAGTPGAEASRPLPGPIASPPEPQRSNPEGVNPTRASGPSRDPAGLGCHCVPRPVPRGDNTWPWPWPGRARVTVTSGPGRGGGAAGAGNARLWGWGSPLHPLYQHPPPQRGSAGDAGSVPAPLGDSHCPVPAPWTRVPARGFPPGLQRGLCGCPFPPVRPQWWVCAGLRGPSHPIPSHSCS